MGSPIRDKITLVILAVALGGIIISGIISHSSLNRQFQYYLRENEQARQEQAVRILADLYNEYGGWENLPPQLGFGRNNALGSLRYVLDNRGHVVLTVRRPMMGPLPPPDSLTSRPIQVGGTKVGTAHFGKTVLENILTQQDRVFRTTINRSILAAMILTGLLAMGIAFYFARRLSAPITEMNQTAAAMTAGDLERRVKNLPRDELGELGTSINRLAERLKEADELRKKMTADVAHDLRTPLTTIRSHLEGMIDRVIPASPENLESLLEEVRRLTGLIEDLQEIAQADRALRGFNPEPVDLGAVMETLIQNHNPLFRAKGIRLEQKKTESVRVETDRAALAKIMDNLLSNAYKYTPPGKSVFVSLVRDGQSARIDVADQGIGIPAADLPYIFERFYRTDQSRNRESGGFGLGLTIVRELVTGLGGTVTVQSVPGEGSIFTVKLPLSWGAG